MAFDVLFSISAYDATNGAALQLHDPRGLAR
jgi:hypothetical protein